MRAGGVEERRRAAARTAGAEGDSPDARHLDRKPVAERPALPVARVGVDPPRPEVRNHEVAAEATERGRSECEAPGLVELVLGTDAADQTAVEVELVDVAAARGVVAVDGCAVGVGDEDAVAEGGDAERGVPGGNARVAKGARAPYRPPVRIEHQHPIV